MSPEQITIDFSVNCRHLLETLEGSLTEINS